jgi:uncharacterized protein (DUF2267 family)
MADKVRAEDAVQVEEQLNKLVAQMYPDGKDILTKQQLRDYLLHIMDKHDGDTDAWDENQFNKAYRRIDLDGDSGIDKHEFK